ncbi:MAG TPA: phosphoribosyltransferase family protein [Planctomycetota bacterium]|nr:phosphoribosyltransferase family protein [Planctomycetota bacterium]
MKIELDSPDAGRFQDRRDAGYQLAWALKGYRGRRPLVLGIPRGGMVLADVIARELGGDLDVALVRKLRAPNHPDLSIGAITESGLIFLIDGWDASPAKIDLKSQAAAAMSDLRQQRRLLSPASDPFDPAGRTVIIVDDGVVTGASMGSALRALQATGARSVIAAVAIASRDSVESLKREADDVVCLAATDSFYAVSPFFLNFAEVTDYEVAKFLRDATRRSRRDRAV